MIGSSEAIPVLCGHVREKDSSVLNDTVLEACSMERSDACPHKQKRAHCGSLENGLQGTRGMSFKAVLLDIEGTVCPIAFVKDVLFPYFSGKVPQLKGSQDAQVQELLSQFRTDDVTAHLQRLVSDDVKDPILKALQGHVWEQGYECGEIQAPVYEDAIRFIEWCSNVFIYSSGSVKAQKLLFGHVKDPQGSATIDLRPSIKAYFDITTSGKKTEAQSYRNIVREIGFGPQNVLFISDNALELDAASAAGLQTCLAVRPGNAPVKDASKYKSVEDFTNL